MIISIQENTAAVVEHDGIPIVFEHCVERPDFEAHFNGVDLSAVRTLAYEPDRSLYHINLIDWSLLVLNHPLDDPRMAYIHINREAIKSWFEEQKECESCEQQA